MDIKMESAVQCPVCTLFLREGMALSAHLDTHPKDQVINALCSLAVPSPATPAPVVASPPAQPSSLSYSLSSTPVPSPYNHRPRLRAPAYTPTPTPSTTPLSFPDHPIYFLQQPPRTAFSTHTDNSSFVLNTKFHDNDSLIMTFVQPAASSSSSSASQLPDQDMVNIGSGQQQPVQHSTFESKPPVQTKSHQPLFYKQLSHQVNQSIKKYVSTVPLIADTQQAGVMVVMQDEGRERAGEHQEVARPNSSSSLDIIKGDSNTSSSTKSGVKILSNVKVELPIQNIPDIIDLTSSHRTQHPDLQEEEAILPDFVDAELCHNYTPTRFRDYAQSPQMESSSTSPHKVVPRSAVSSGGSSSVVNTFSVIKNIGNPNLYKDTSSQHSEDNKGSDSSLLPDLTCNEHPSISPCSDLTNDSSETLYERTTSTNRSLHLSNSNTPVTMYQGKFESASSPAKASSCSSSDKNHGGKPGSSCSGGASDCAAPSTSTSTSSIVNNYSIDLARIHQGLDNHSTDIGRLDGFFKDIERNKRSIEITHVSLEQSRGCPAVDEDDDSIGCARDVSVCKESHHKVEECALASLGVGVDKLLDNLSQKSYTEMENMRPVNVIAFGSMLPTTTTTPTADTHPSTSMIYQDLSKSVCTLTPHKYIVHDNYNDYFSSGSGNVKGSCKENSNTITPWDSHLAPTQKEEFGLNTFIEISQMQQYTSPAATVGVGVEQAAGSQGDTLPSEACVPGATKAAAEDCGRKELSEHDTPWPGMYCDVGGSTSYDLLARETWHSDGSDVDMPITPTKDTYNDSEDIPIVVGIKPPERNYRCGTCGKTFNCPKERRVHRSKEHPMSHQAAGVETSNSEGDQVQAGNRTEERSQASGGGRKSKKRVMGGAAALLKPMHIKNEILNNDVSTTNKLKEEVSNGGVAESQGLGVQYEEDKKPKLEVDNSLLLVGTNMAANILDIKNKKRKREWTCGTCKQEFQGQTEYNQHLKEHPLECLTCGKYFYRRSNMQLHMKRHLGIKNYKCEVCEKRFITKQKMLEHYYGHTGNTPVKCGLCNESFRRHSNMVQHRNKHHFLLKKKLKDYICHCGEVFHTKKKLAWHKEIHEEKPKACPHCSEKFIHTASLSRHMRRAHNTLFTQLSDGNAECGICHQVYLRTSLDSHMRTHAGARPYSCHICNKSFTTKWNLKLHRWTHANRSSKPFKCSLCKGAFIRQADYISHMNSHKSVRPYTCNYCGCQFIRKYNCQRHVKEHENDKKFACQVADCGKSFHRSYYLAEHMRVHSGHRPFACNICGKTSSTKSNHNKHVKIHHAREPVTTEG